MVVFLSFMLIIGGSSFTCARSKAVFLIVLFSEGSMTGETDYCLKKKKKHQ